MKVSELQELLKHADPDLDVVVAYDDMCNVGGLESRHVFVGTEYERPTLFLCARTANPAHHMKDYQGSFLDPKLQAQREKSNGE